MYYSKQYIIQLSKETNFLSNNIEKVLRLVDVLKMLNTDPFFKGKFVLKGGTAINLAILDIPRLSVDIDLDLCENVNKSDLLILKEIISNKLKNFMIQNDYTYVANSKEYYALSSLVFSYINCVGNKDNIKVEINYVDRCHVLPVKNVELSKNNLFDSFNVDILDKTELFASKINALLSRSLIRDLYDVSNMIDYKLIENESILRKCIIFYNVIGGEQNIDNVDYSRIMELDYYIFKKQLKPVLAKDAVFDIEDSKNKVIQYLKRILIFEKKEIDFVKFYRQGIYLPNLLFDDTEIIDRIILHPMAVYRILNSTSTDFSEVNKDLVSLYLLHKKLYGCFSIDVDDKIELLKALCDLIISYVLNKCLSNDDWILIKKINNFIV